MKYNRQKEMLAYIEDKRSVRNEELLEKFNVSIQTLRRDLKTFEDQGFIDKVYGGFYLAFAVRLPLVFGYCILLFLNLI